MATFLKRQKEMKRLEKQREKAERRAQKKLVDRTPGDPSADIMSSGELDALRGDLSVPLEAEPHN
jgi:hypothetical protein